MNDKELFRYLQELKVILNDINSTKEENKKAIYNLKDQLESLRITYNMYFFEYKLFRMKVLYLSIIRLVFTKKHKNMKLNYKMNY